MSSRLNLASRAEAQRRRDLAYQCALDKKSLEQELNSIAIQQKKVLQQIEADEKALWLDHHNCLKHLKKIGDGNTKPCVWAEAGDGYNPNTSHGPGRRLAKDMFRPRASSEIEVGKPAKGFYRLEKRVQL